MMSNINKLKIRNSILIVMGVIVILTIPLLLHLSGGDALSRYPGGAKKIVGRMIAGQYTGIVREYYANGCLRSVTSYELGKKNGLSTVYYIREQHPLPVKSFLKVRVLNIDIRGTIAQQINYKNDFINGVYKEFAPSGYLQRETNYLGGQKNGLDIVYSDGKKKIQEFTYVQGKLHGPSIEYYASGMKKRSTSYTWGRPDGLQQLYFESGKLMANQWFAQGVPIKTWTNYYENGQRQRQTVYVNGLCEGFIKHYYENGDLYLVQPYIHGVHMGIDRYYFAKNILHMEVPYVNGRIEGIKKTYADGTIVAAEQYVLGLQDGLAVYYRSENGSIKEQTMFKAGNKHGQSIQFYRNGSVKMESTFVYGKLDGFVHKYYEKDTVAGNFFKIIFNFLFGWLWPDTNKGQLEYAMPYANGQQDGLAHIYYRSGMVNWEQNYSRGKLHGESRCYYESGTLMTSIPFKQGKEHGIARANYPSGKLMLEREYRNGKEIAIKSFRQ